jgi:hypothetical protein
VGETTGNADNFTLHVSNSEKGRDRHCEEQRDDPPSLAMRAMAGLESAEAPLRVGGSNPFFLCAARWIASRSLSSGAHSRDPLARNDGIDTTPQSRGAECARAVAKTLSLERIEGAGKAGCPMHPQPRVQNLGEAHEHSHYRFAGNTQAFPAQWFTAYTCSPR